MAINDVFAVNSTITTQEGKPFLNVYFYRQVTAGTSSLIPTVNLRQAWRINFVEVSSGERLLDLISVTASMTSLYTYNLFNPEDFNTQDYGAVTYAGERGGEPLPNSNAWGFRSNRTRRDIRRGFKRISPMAEPDVVGNEPLPGLLPALIAFAGALGSDVSNTAEAGSPLFEPVVVKRIKEVDPITGAISYRLPNSPGETQVSVADLWGFTKVTTQVSRKA